MPPGSEVVLGHVDAKRFLELGAVECVESEVPVEATLAVADTEPAPPEDIKGTIEETDGPVGHGEQLPPVELDPVVTLEPIDPAPAPTVEPVDAPLATEPAESHQEKQS
jgi:hypothetical protein